MRPAPILLAVLAAGLLARGAAAQSAAVRFPDTGPGRLLEEYVELCDAPTLEAFSAWQSAHIAPAILGRQSLRSIAEDDVRQCRDNGGFEPRRIETDEPSRVDLLAIGKRSGLWTRLTLGVDSAGAIRRLGIFPALPPESALPEDLGNAALARALREKVRRLSEAGMFSGIVEIARGGEVIAVATGGWADREARTPITGSSRFTIGSMGKMFTAVAVGQLVDRGRLSFSDTVGEFFPDYPNETVRHEVTVGMLLSHTSGMGDFLAKRTPGMLEHGVERASEFMPLFDRDSLRFAPGTDWAYSNAGLALAGAIVEKVAGQPYPGYLREHVFAPAGMTGSDPNNIPHADSALVTPYTRFSPKGPPGDSLHEAEHDIGSPAGGAISTADDLVRFAGALRSGELVSPATFREMTRPHGNPGYGYAMEIHEVYGRTVVGHGGGFPGVSTHLDLVSGSPYTVVVLSNLDPPAEARISRYAVALAVEKAKRE